MRDQRQDLLGLAGQLTSQLPSDTGRVILFVGAHAGEGVSSVAASFAKLTAERADRPVWLLDLDLLRNAAYQAFSEGAFSKVWGGVGSAFAAGLKSPPFHVVDPEVLDPQVASRLFTVHRVGDTRLMVTRFSSELLAAGQTVRIRSAPDYWRAARLAMQWTIVDAPSLDQSAAALAVAPYADAVVLVVRADATTPEAAWNLRREIDARGGRIAGVVMTGVKPDARRASRWA